MADEDDEGPVSQTSFGLAYNPLLPMGDPLAYARVGAAPEPMVPRVNVQGAQPQQVYRPPPVNVPPITGGRGSAAPEGGTENQLQPPQDQLGMGQLGGLGQLLQMRGLMDVSQPSAATTTPAATATTSAADVPVGGSASGPHPRNVSAVNAGPYTDEVNTAAVKYGNDPKLFTHMLYRESQFNPSAVSPAGAIGIGQFMPATAKERGLDPTDPHRSIDESSKYLAELTKRYNGNVQLGLMGYNWGPRNVDNWLRNGADPAKAPKETQDYVRDITGRPIGPNMSPRANAPSASAAPMALMTTAPGGGFALPGQRPPGNVFAGPGAPSAPGFGQQPKAGDMSPHGGVYVNSGGKLYATDESGKIVGPAVTEIAPDLKFDPNKRDVETSTTTKPAPAPTPSQVPPVREAPVSGVPYTGDRVPPAVLSPGGRAGGPNPTPPGPVQPPAPISPTGATGGLQPRGFMGNGFLNNVNMDKLWQYMLIRSLFPQIQFRNINYDPWAVHRFGQGGGY